ncbi:putative armadillo-like helical protein [Helianthus anomalus]
MEGLESKDWLKICDSLNDVRQLALFHSELLLPILEMVNMVLVKAMKNPSSVLCKTAIMAASDPFKSFGDKLLEASTPNDVETGEMREYGLVSLVQTLAKLLKDRLLKAREAARGMVLLVYKLVMEDG